MSKCAFRIVADVIAPFSTCGWSGYEFRDAAAVVGFDFASKFGL